MDMVIEECPDCMIQLDAGWAWYGNMDVVGFMKKHGNRIASGKLIFDQDASADIYADVAFGIKYVQNC